MTSCFNHAQKLHPLGLIADSDQTDGLLVCCLVSYRIIDSAVTMTAICISGSALQNYEYKEAEASWNQSEPAGIFLFWRANTEYMLEKGLWKPKVKQLLGPFYWSKLLLNPCECII